MKRKNDKGAITLFVLIAGLSFIAFLTTMLAVSSVRRQAQIEATKQAKEIYSQGDANTIYEEYFVREGAIPIYTVEQLNEMCTGHEVAIPEENRKIYTFSSDAVYVLMNDLAFECEGFWKLPTYTENGRFEGNGKVIRLLNTRENIQCYYSSENNYQAAIFQVNAELDDNIIVINNQNFNGLSIRYDSESSILTLNGTSTSSNGILILNRFENFIFTEGEQFTHSVQYISGTATGSGNSTIAAEAETATHNVLSTRFYVDPLFGTTENKSITRTVTEMAATEGKALRYCIWFQNGASAWTFDNYKVKIDLHKVQTKQVMHGLKYGNLPILEKDGYTFDGWSLIPNEYQQVEYISSNGTQYINTGVNGNNSNLSIEIKYQWNEIPGDGQYSNVVASYESELCNATRIIQYGSNITYFNINTKAGGGSGTLTYTRDINTIYEEKLYSTEDDLIYISNEINTERNIIGGNTTNKNIGIFGSSIEDAVKSNIKLYYLKIYDNGTIIRNFIPCYRRRDNVAGLYDTVNNIFYTDEANGSAFNVGRDKKIDNNSFVIDINNHTLYSKWNANENILTGTLAPEVKNPPTNENAGWHINTTTGELPTRIDVISPPLEGITKGFELIGHGSDQYSYIEQYSVPVIDGKEYIMSVWAKGSGVLYLQLAGQEPWTAKGFTLNNVTDWTKYSWVVTAGNQPEQATMNNGIVNAYFVDRGVVGTSFQICGMSLIEK